MLTKLKILNKVKILTKKMVSNKVKILSEVNIICLVTYNLKIIGFHNHIITFFYKIFFFQILQAILTFLFYYFLKKNMTFINLQF